MWVEVQRATSIHEGHMEKVLEACATPALHTTT